MLRLSIGLSLDCLMYALPGLASILDRYFGTQSNVLNE